MKKIGTLKFAIYVMTFFILLLIIGTLVEVKYGPIVAKHYVYESNLFVLNVFLILLSLLFSMLERPFAKMFYGFYMIHTGLIIIGCGAMISVVSSFEGQLKLFPNENSNILVINEYELEIHRKGKDSAIVKLPVVIAPTELESELKGIKLLKYIPFADEESFKIKKENGLVAELEIYNDKIFESMSLVNDIGSQYHKVSSNLGPLQIKLLPVDLKPCLSSSNFILVDINKRKCASISDKEVTLIKGNKLVRVSYNSSSMVFAPGFSSIPLDDEGKEILGAPFELYSLEILKSKPSLWIAKNNTYYFDKKSKKIEVSNSSKLVLPWMGLRANIKRFNDMALGLNFVDRDTKEMLRPAVKFNVSGKDYWVNKNNSASIIDGKNHYLIQLKPQKKYLPFYVTLNEFVVSKDFGTGTDAGYESKINIFSKGVPKSATISLNNPLKEMNFTLYQESYKKLAGGRFLSILRVNVDPGRYAKYIGWFLALFGMIIHFNFRRIKL